MAVAGAAARRSTTRELEQWFFRITHYADELLEAADRLSGWPDKVLTMQRNWIGRSEGARLRFELVSALGQVMQLRKALTRPPTADTIEVFTTRIELGVADAERIPMAANGSEAEGEILPVWCADHEIRSVIVVTTPDHSKQVRRVLGRAMDGRATTVIVRPTRVSSFEVDR